MRLLAYPLSTWLLGPFDLFVEHGHRLLGALVGFLSILLLAAGFAMLTGELSADDAVIRSQGAAALAENRRKVRRVSSVDMSQLSTNRKNCPDLDVRIHTPPRIAAESRY